MKKVLLVTLSCLMSFTAYASAEIYEYLGVKTVKGNPCYLTNGQFTESSINFMVSAYGDFKEKPRQ
ncbi:hypothetical protein [uncultured Endozoicomonas sp.]|uniref:hypothetical protein n=1 Tax=uncultured Endozoicomonas sp. TaxID=432652 RepID=UPI0026035310|nr:hypothetical protein [uncultured Endozoicomonas sp.]